MLWCACYDNNNNNNNRNLHNNNNNDNAKQYLLSFPFPDNPTCHVVILHTLLLQIGI